MALCLDAADGEKKEEEEAQEKDDEVAVLVVSVVDDGNDDEEQLCFLAMPKRIRHIQRRHPCSLLTQHLRKLI